MLPYIQSLGFHTLYKYIHTLTYIYNIFFHSLYNKTYLKFYFPQNFLMKLDWLVVVQSLSHVWPFATPWTTACQAFPSFTIFWSLLKLMSVESMMPSRLILCCPLLFLPSIFFDSYISTYFIFLYQQPQICRLFHSNGLSYILISTTLILYFYINNLRYADNTTLTAESEEELKSLLMRMKEERGKAGLKLNIKKTKIMVSDPIISW